MSSTSLSSVMKLVTGFWSSLLMSTPDDGSQEHHLICYCCTYTEYFRDYPTTNNDITEYSIQYTNSDSREEEWRKASFRENIQVVWPINYSVTNFFRLFLTKNGIFLKRRAAKFLFFRQWSNIIQRRVVFVMSFPLLYNIDNIQKMKFIQIFLWRMIESQIHAKYLLQILTYLFVHFVSLNAILRQGREIT